MNRVYLSLGSNEGNRLKWLTEALNKIKQDCGDIIKISNIYETKAWGLKEQPDFLNRAVLISTTLSPLDLLNAINKIETSLGRIRTQKWGPRTLDIDILFYNNEIINLPQLIVPHPYIQERLFTLQPLNDIAPDFMHPLLYKTISELLAVCKDDLEIEIYKS